MNNLLAVLADIANGLFAVLLTSYLTDTGFLWWHGLVGIAMAMSPDLDAVGEVLKRGRVSASDEHDQDHREGLHYPLLFLLLGLVAIYFMPYWGLLFLVATLLHFGNDFYGTGWGIKLFWPLSSTNFKLLGRRANQLKQLLVDSGQWETLPPAERKLRVLVSWKKDELSSYIKKYGIDKWVESYYLRLNWISGIEYSLFVIAVLWYLQALLY